MVLRGTQPSSPPLPRKHGPKFIVVRDLFFWLTSTSTLPGPKKCSKPSVLSKFLAPEKGSRPRSGREHFPGAKHLLWTEGFKDLFGPGRVEKPGNRKNRSRTTIIFASAHLGCTYLGRLRFARLETDSGPISCPS